MVASLLVATSAFGQSTDNCNPCKPAPCAPPKPACPPPSCCKPCPPPREPLPCPTIPAYNAPARWETRCAWDVWVDASFIYWQPYEDGLDPAVFFKAPPVIAFDTVSTASVGEVNFKTKFKPGFKVGVGMNFDHDSWDGHAEYTRFHSIHKMSGSSTFGYGPLLMPLVIDTILALDLAGGGDPLTSFKERWTLNMDFIDVDMGRWYWVGTALTFRPSVGARGGWLNQKLFSQFTTAPGAAIAVLASTNDKSRSWCVGPRMGIETNWMLGSWGCNPNCWDGFRFYGNGYADILFTRYKRISQAFLDASAGGVSTTAANLQFAQYKFNTIRTHLDLEMGIGWASYFDNNNWHLDLSAGYGFQVFFKQNEFAGGTAASPNTDLTIQGLTATARLDF